jgi:hypothetical protein|nr:hypothetical protein [uncultured Acetatifactor sp.]
MEESKWKGMTLEFREESVSNVIYEDSAAFGRSVSNEAYRKAFQITQTILSINDRYQDKGKKGGTAIRNRGQFFNIIAFIGGRGTGKTSAMLSYMEFLKDYYRNAHSGDENEKLGDMYFHSMGDEKVKELMFTGLEHIDASLLGSRSDDVLRNILPKMLKKWHDEERRSYRDSGIVRDEDYAYKKRHIQMLFNNVYKSLRDLNSSKDILESDNDMFMETLENLSLTWNLRQSFQELVEAYLEIMEYPGSEGKIHLNNHFLVISLDDLDMNIDHGFELLEEIRKYLMVPNVIVLLTASYSQLEMLCVEHYTKAFKETKADNGTKEYIERLAKEYLEKILPAHCQVAMEPVHGWKAYDQKKIGLKYITIRGIEYTPVPETIKKIIQRQLIEYIGIKFTGEGVNLARLVPDTIRELAVWIRQVYSLEPVTYTLEDMRNLAEKPSGAEEQEDHTELTSALEVYNRNLKWFLKGRLFPLYDKHLDRNAEFIEYLAPKGQIQTVKELLYVDEEDSLLESLAKSLAETRQIQESAVLSVIYFTVKLTQLFTSWYCGDEDSQSSLAVQAIKQYFEEGIWGKWEEKMMCKVKAPEESMFCDIARIKFGALSNCLDHILGEVFSANSKDNKNKFIKKNVQRIQNYQMLLLFFEFSADFTFSGSKLVPEEGKYRLTLEMENCRGKFALSNIMCPWEEKDRVLDDFQNTFLQLMGADKDAGWKEQILDIIDIRKTDNNYIIIPAENVEYLIRTGQELEEKFDDSIVVMETDKICGKIVEYFAVIKDSLKEYDEMFGTIYEENFNRTQIGRELLKVSQDQKISDGDLLYMLSETIEHVAVPEATFLFD